MADRRPLGSDWRRRATCRALVLEGELTEAGSLDLFYAASDDEEYGSNASEALAICGRCPAREPCLAYALAHEDLGIWGGATARQRRRLRKAMGIVLDTPTVITRGRDWVEDLRDVPEPTDDELEEAAGW